ncbi:MAG: hypothetical protein Q3966_09165 [Neisseria sp.]|nr:hypothetical protein [Neisseria sp.]
MIDYYELLGISRKADHQAIERAIALHAEHQSLTLEQLQAARAILLDTENRRRYNETLQQELPETPSMAEVFQAASETQTDDDPPANKLPYWIAAVLILAAVCYRLWFA